MELYVGTLNFALGHKCHANPSALVTRCMALCQDFCQLAGYPPWFLPKGRELYWFNSGLIPGATAGAYQGGLIGAYYNLLGLIFTDNLLIARGGLGRECDQDPDTRAPSHSSD